MRRIGEWRYSSTHSLTSARDGSEWSASRSGRWVGPIAALGAVVRRMILALFNNASANALSM
jgi:hypothetical protein